MKLEYVGVYRGWWSTQRQMKWKDWQKLIRNPHSYLVTVITWTFLNKDLDFYVKNILGWCSNAFWNSIILSWRLLILSSYKQRVSGGNFNFVRDNLSLARWCTGTGGGVWMGRNLYAIIRVQMDLLYRLIIPCLLARHIRMDPISPWNLLKTSS